MVMAAGLAGKLAVKGARAGIRRLRRPKKKIGAPVRRRQRRIVFSENQWMFVQQLIRATTGRSMPSMPGGRRRRKRTPFR